MSAALVEKIAIVASFRGQHRGCVRGPRGKICDGGALQRTASQVCPRPSWKKLRWWRPSEASVAGASAALVEQFAIVAPNSHKPHPHSTLTKRIPTQPSQDTSPPNFPQTPIHIHHALNFHKSHQVLEQKTYLRSHLRTSPKTVPLHNKCLKHARGTPIL